MTIFTVAAEDILGENYKLTKIECTDYNPNIDDSITLTIILTDVYDDPIDGENVTVTASEGTFTQLNGSDITASDSVTGTTNSSGQFTLTYACSEWGLITFSANNSKIQVNVTGIYTTTVNCNTNLKFTSTTSVRFQRFGNVVVASIYNSNCKPTSTGWQNFCSIPSGYRPANDIYCSETAGTSNITQVSTTGQNNLRAYVSTAPSANIYFGFFGVWVTTDTPPSS